MGREMWYHFPIFVHKQSLTGKCGEMGEHELLTVSEAAQYLRISERTIRAMIKRGDLKATKLGKAYRIKREDLTNVIDNKKQ